MDQRHCNFKLLIMLFALILQSCGTLSERQTTYSGDELGEVTHIHLHTYGLKRKAVAKIRNRLESKGFVLQLRENKFPGELKSNLIIYNLGRNKKSELGLVIDTLTSSGFRMNRVYEETYKRHTYSQGNIGVYVFSWQESN